MSTVLQVTFGEGDVAEQLHMLKISALRNNDTPALWRLTETLIEILLATARRKEGERWPRGYVSEERLFDVPVDFVRELPHLLCECHSAPDNRPFIIYPFTCASPKVIRVN